MEYVAKIINKDRNGRSTWVCSNHHKYGNEGCKAKPIYEEVLVKVLLGILKSEEINEEIFKENIEKIKIEENRIVTVILKNGKSVEKGMM